MADFTALKTAIQNYIKQNGNEEITGAILQDILLSVVTTLGDSAINDLITSLGNEVSARQNADATLQGNITAEATARGNADTALQTAINDEARYRANADGQLQGYINGIMSMIENGYVYAGIATPSTTPATGKVFYLALQGGMYTNFDNIAIMQGINILKYDGSDWQHDAYIAISDKPIPSGTGLVKAGGTFDFVMDNGSAFDISKYFASGSTLATYADLSAALTALNGLDAAYKRGGMSIRFVQSSVQSSDNKYIRYNLIADEFTTDVTKWAIDDVGVYVENPEFIYVMNDAEDKILWAIRIDGGIYYGAGCPQQVKDYIEEKISSLSLDEYEDIVTFLNDYLGGDATLKSLIDSKLDAEGLDPDALDTMQAIDNPEYLQVTLDSEDKVLEGIKADGTKVIGGNLQVEGNVINSILQNKLDTIDEIQDTVEELKTDIEEIDFYNVSEKFPNDGNFGDNRYDLSRAISKIPNTYRSKGIQIKFVNFGRYYEVWQRIGDEYAFDTITSWKRIDIPFDYLVSCENRLANPLYETFEHYNQENPTSPIIKEFVAGNDGIKRRIPVSEISNSGTILVACEKRNTELQNADYGEFSLEFARKPVNGQWNNQIIAPYSLEKGFVANVSLLIERDNSQGHQGRIYAFFGRYTIMNFWSQNTYESSDFVYMYSDDDGVTWSEEISLKLWDSSQLKTVIPAPTKGIQLINGTLVVPCMGVIAGTTNQYRSLILYKQVGGNWTFSNIIDSVGITMNECAIVEKEENTVCLISRNENKVPPYREDHYGLPTFIYNFSTNNWTGSNSTFIHYHSCELSLQKVIINNSVVFLMSALDVPDKGVDRINTTIWASLDLNKWIRIYRVQKEASWGYSGLAFYNNQLVVAYESNQNNKKDIYCQDISVLIPLIGESVSKLKGPNLTVQDRIQEIINLIKGIE